MSREAWQADCLANNFPGGADTAPFLPPAHINEAKAWELSANSPERNFDTFAANRVQSVQDIHEELQLVVPQVHMAVRSGILKAIEQGYAPTTALGRVEAAFTQTAIQATDPSLLQEDELATYTRQTDIMAVSADAIDYDLPQTIAHEIGGHKISGGTFAIRDDGKVDRVRRGFVSHTETLGDATGRHYGLDEAVQQHLTLAYLYGQFDVLDPDRREDRDQIYYEHRKLLAEYVLRAGGVIDLKAIARASFEDTEPGSATTADRRTMAKQASMAYGPGAYRKLSLLFDALDLNDLTADELAEYIQAPELGADGTVRTPGSIITDELFPPEDHYDGW